MGKWTELLQKARCGPANVRFRDLCGLIERLGFVQRGQVGSHRIFRHVSRPELPLVNLQTGPGGKAKPYQVKQVLALVELYGLEVEE